MSHDFKPVFGGTKGWYLRDEKGNHVTDKDGYTIYYRNARLARNASAWVFFDTENEWFTVS